MIATIILAELCMVLIVILIAMVVTQRKKIAFEKKVLQSLIAKLKSENKEREEQLTAYLKVVHQLKEDTLQRTAEELADTEKAFYKSIVIALLMRDKKNVQAIYPAIKAFISGLYQLVPEDKMKQAVLEIKQAAKLEQERQEAEAKEKAAKDAEVKEKAVTEEMAVKDGEKEHETTTSKAEKSESKESIAEDTKSDTKTEVPSKENEGSEVKDEESTVTAEAENSENIDSKTKDEESTITEAAEKNENIEKEKSKAGASTEAETVAKAEPAQEESTGVKITESKSGEANKEDAAKQNTTNDTAQLPEGITPKPEEKSEVKSSIATEVATKKEVEKTKEEKLDEVENKAAELPVESAKHEAKVQQSNDQIQTEMTETDSNEETLMSLEDIAFYQARLMTHLEILGINNDEVVNSINHVQLDEIDEAKKSYN